MDYDLRRGRIYKYILASPQNENEDSETQVEYYAEYIEIHHFSYAENDEHYKIRCVSKKAESKTDSINEPLICLLKQLLVIGDKITDHLRASACTHKGYHFPSGDAFVSG